jgi:hypothetical protein
MLEKDGEYQLDRSCEKMKYYKEEKNMLYAVNKRKATRIGCVLCRILPSKTWYCRKNIRHEKARKKM